MCGIAGVHDPRGRVDQDTLAEMVGAMAHRGPDGDGFYFGDEIGLGMRRLAIVDPENGRQPLTNETGTVQVVYNGEIYNHAELRAGLGARGHKFASDADGEVLPHLWEEKGPDLLGDLNGIFAIALWDEEQQVLLLARDQLGVKPLYLHTDGPRISFASEIKALLLDPRVPRRLDLGALDQHLTFRFTPSPRTLLQGVEKLPPATAVLAGRTSKRWRYWAPRPEPVSGVSFRDATAEFTSRLSVAVRRQMMSDRPIGVMFSGGIDSALIARLMIDAGANVRTFTVGFEGGGLETNEIPLARASARALGTEHRDRLIERGDFQAGLERTIEMLEEPVATSSALGFYEVSRLAAEDGVPVLLSGQGADEPLAGYWRHVGEWLAMGRVRRTALNAAGSVLRAAPGSRSVRVQRGLESLRYPPPTQRFLATYAMFSPEAKRALYSPDLQADVAGVHEGAMAIEQFRSQVSGRDSLQQMLYVDTRLWLPDDLLLVGDKTSMAASVEMRVPFLDPELVEFVERLPSSYKLRLGRRKAIEKAAARGLLPREILRRRERGFATPVGRWLREAHFFEFTRGTLLDSGAVSADLFNRRHLKKLLDEHREGAADNSRQLYTLLAFELWCRRFLKPPGG